MLKKMYKGLFFFLLVIFMAGSFCLFPNLKALAQTPTEKAEVVDGNRKSFKETLYDFLGHSSQSKNAMALSSSTFSLNDYPKVQAKFEEMNRKNEEESKKLEELMGSLSESELYNKYLDLVFQHTENLYIDTFIDNYTKINGVEPGENELNQAKEDAKEHIWGRKYFSNQMYGHNYVMNINDANDLIQISHNINFVENTIFDEVRDLSNMVLAYDYFSLHDEYFDSPEQQQTFLDQEVCSKEQYESAKFNLKLYGLEDIWLPRVLEGQYNYIPVFTAGTYSLETNIDLAGSFWTPISSFVGVFYGNGHTISNIKVDDVSLQSSNQYVGGLFCDVQNSTICDLILDGKITVTSNNPNASLGTLAGRVNDNSTIINCFDKSSSEDLPAIGLLNLNTNYQVGVQPCIFTGNTFDGENVIWRNYVEYMNYSIQNKIGKINKNSSASILESHYIGEVICFKSGEGKFKHGNDEWHEKNYRYLMPSMSTSKTYSNRANIYGKIPKLRTEAVGNEVYIINPGKKAILKNPYDMNYDEYMEFFFVFSGEVDEDGNPIPKMDEEYEGPNAEWAYLMKPLALDIEYSDESFYANFIYGYGDNSRGQNIQLPYDVPFCDIFDMYPGLKERAGYNFERFYQNLTDENGETQKVDMNIENADHFKDSYPNYTIIYNESNDTYTVEKQNYYFDWTYNSDVQRNFGVKFAYSRDEGGKIVNNFSSVDKIKSMLAHENGVAKIEGIKDASAGMLDKGIIFENSEAFAEGSDDYTFKITLARGYRLIAIEDGIQKYVSSKDKPAVIENYRSNTVSGAHSNFLEWTGEGLNYSGNESRNNDFYNSVLVKTNWTNAGDRYYPDPNHNDAYYNQRAGFSNEKEYEITLNNIVGPGGYVVLVIERDWTYVDITPHLVDKPTSFSFNIEDGWYLKETSFEIDGNIITGMFPTDKDGNLMYDLENNNIILPNAFITYGKGNPWSLSMDYWLDNEGNRLEAGDWGFYYFNDTIVESNGEYNFYLQMRKGDEVKLNISVETIGRYMLNIDTDRFMLSNGGADESVFATYKTAPAEGANGVFEGAKPEDNFYDKWDIILNNHTDYSSTFRVYIGAPKTKVAINLYKGDVDSREALDDMTGVGVSINNSTYFQNVTSELIGMSASGVISSKKSGKYQAYKAVVSEYLDGTNPPQYSKNPSIYLMNDSGSKYTDAYYDTSYIAPVGNMIFKKAFTHEEAPLYVVDIYYQERTYDIKVEYYAGSKLVPVSQGDGQGAIIPSENVDQIKAEFTDKYFSQVDFGFTAQLPSILKGGGTYSFSFLLNNVGRGALTYAGFELYQDDKLKVGFGNSGNPESWEKDGYTNSSLVEPANPGVTDGDFNLTLGGYDTTIKIFFEYRTVNILIDKVHVLNEEGYLGVEDNALLAYQVNDLTYKIGADGSLTLSSGINELSSISIHSQYYLLGWYLQNGKSINVDSNGNFNGFLTDGEFVSGLAELGADKEGTYVSDSVSALVGRRTVSANYNAGTAGHGRLYENIDSRLDNENRNLVQVDDGAINRTKAGQNFLYNSAINLSKYAFYNLGYAFNGYTPNGVTVNNGTLVFFGHVDNDNMTYIISGQGWDELFKLAKAGDGTLINNINGDSFQSWNGLAESQLQRMAEVELICQWNKISYSAIIDETTAVSNSSTGKTGLSIGDTIYFTTSPAPDNKNGLAVYVIDGNTLSGQTKFGYYAKGFAISQDEIKDGFNHFVEGEANAITITPDIFLSFIKDEYRFIGNSSDDNIYINTVREEADYLIYLDNSENDYYFFDWNENLDTNDYGEIIDGRIAIHVKYNNPALNLVKAIDDGVLIVTRFGYNADKNLWSWSSDASQTLTMLKPQDKYLITGDIAVVPTWIKDSENPTKSEISFKEDVGENRNFYLLNEHDIITAGASGNHVADDIDILRKPILRNGEQIVGFKFIVTLNGGEEKIFENIKDFNISNLDLSGGYLIKFVLYVKDTLTKYNESGAYSIEYSQDSKILTFNMVKNELFFFDNNFTSIYNRSTDYSPADGNNYGKFMLKYDWNGIDKTQNENLNEFSIGLTEEYFKNFAISGDYNASANTNDKKDIEFLLNLERPILGKDGANFANLLINVLPQEDEFIVTLENVLNIEKAKFTIHFPNGSAYRFDNINAVVYENLDDRNFNDDFANGKTFTYTLDKIILLVNEVGTYTGSENFNIDKDIFNIYGLKIEGDKLSNFEWNIANFDNFGDSRFILKGIDTAKGYTYDIAYMLASNGKLNADLTRDYLGENDIIELSDLMINGKAYNLPATTQGSIEVDNNIIFSFAGNGTNVLKLFVNDEILALYPFSVKVNIRLCDEHASALKLLTFTNDTNLTMLDAMLDSWTNSGYSTTIAPSISDGKTNNFTAVLTDVVKVYVNYNSGKSMEELENETIYISVSNNVFKLNNPLNIESNYLAFNGYDKKINSNLDISFDSQYTSFKVLNSCAVESITAKWLFTDFEYEVYGELNIFASENEIEQKLNSFVLVNAPNRSSLNASMVNADGSIRFAYNQNNGSIIIKDSQNMAGADLSGIYTLEVTLTYNDGFGDQQLTKSKEVKLTLKRKTIYFYFVNEDLTYNNNQQNVSIIIEKDSDASQVSLNSIPKIDNSVNNRYGFFINIFDSLGQSAVLKNAGVYTIRATVDSRIQNVYQFDNEEEIIEMQLVIKKYTIALKDFNDQIGFMKYVGTNDPALNFNIEIDHDGNAEEVELIFDREQGGAVGNYLLINPAIVDSEDRVNYQLDQTDFEAYFVIETPNANLQLELKEKPNYIYNSLVVNRMIVTVENNSFVLSLYNDDILLYSVEFDVYYLSANGDKVDKIYISDDAKEDHIKLLNFYFENISANAGDYNLIVSLNEVEGFDYTGIDFVDKTMARLKIEKKEVNVLSIEKKFNRNDVIGRNDADIEGIIEGDELYITGRYSQITVGQNITLIDVLLAGSSAGNYRLNKSEFVGNIVTTEVESVAFDIKVKEFIYGQFKNGMTVNEAFKLTNGFNFSIGSHTDDIKNGYVQVSAIILGENLSTGGFLKAGQRQIIFVFTSENFTGLNEDGYGVYINIKQLEIDLSSLEIEKKFDETTSLPLDLDENIDKFILNGDVVSIDRTKGGYQSADPDQNKKVTIVLKGEDNVNYKVKDNVTGSIKAFSITVTVNASTEHADLVSGGKFVEDNLLPNGDNVSFVVGYPLTQSVSDILKSFTAPTRKGYTFSGWKIRQGEGYITFDENNFESVMKKLALESKDEDIDLTIYAVWEIEKYEINISGQQIDHITFTATSGAISEVDGKQYVEYFSDIRIEVLGVRGYKIRAYNLALGQSQDKNLTDVGKNKGIITFGKVASKIELVVIFEQIVINFNINFNMPQFTNRVDTNSLTQSYNYFALENLTKEDLPKLAVTEGTYIFLGYTYDNEELNSQSLKDFVDQIFAQLDTDKIIEIKAMWQGEKYSITFDPTQGTIEQEGTEVIDAIYGQAITPFPNAILEGRSAIWKDKNGKEYFEGDKLATIGEKGEEDYQITLTAEWISESFDATITFESGLTVRVGGREISSGTTFALVYGQDSLSIEVTAKKGYSYGYDTESLKATVEEVNGRVIIRNLFEDGNIHFTLNPNLNTLTLFNTNVDSFEVFIDDQQVESQTNINAYTGQRVEVVYKAKKGYNFTESSYSFRGEGAFTTELSQDGKTLSIKWNDFTGNAVITVDATPSINKVTVGDVRDIFMRLTFGTTNINLSGDTFMVKTGESFIIYGVMAYGYTAGIPNTGDINYVVDGSLNNYYSEEDKYYHFTAMISGFDEDFAISFTAKARSFNFKIGVMPGQEEFGEITCQTEQKVDFGSAIILSQNTLLPNFEFAGWTIGEQIISTEGNINYIVSSAIKDALERAGEDGIIEIYANFVRKARDITLTARTTNNLQTNKNGFIASQIDENISVEVNGTTTVKFFLGLNLDITLNIHAGYELDYVLVDGSRINLSDEIYHYDGNKFAIALDLDSTISSIEVVFKAGEIDVIVQAGTIVNYVDSLGTDVGGCVWAVDKNGERLGEEVYREYQGKLLIGANYKILSHTDEVLYFEVEAKNGFTPSISASVGITINELNINGKKIYAIMGATHNSNITVLFTARENKLNIIFSNEGEAVKAVHGGVIVVDTSSALVSSNPSRGDNVKVSIVTGGTLNITVSSMISYSLVTDEFGNIKYDLIGGEDNGNIIAGKVETQDPVQTGTGFTAIANLTFKDIISDGTIVIYVKPKEYSVKFVVDVERDLTVTMSEKVRYGEEWSLDSLSASEKGLIFASKKDYTFTGYYTAENSYGVQYIDRYGEVVLNWQHSGYTHDGNKYQVDGNFDPATDTFTLYAGWIYNRASVRVEIVPVSIAENKNLSIRSFATNINSFDPWIGQEDIWYAEIGVGAVLNFTAPKIDGYVFVGFSLQFEGGAEIAQNNNFNLTLEMGDYIVRARYNPTIDFKVKNTNNDLANGGNTFARQDGGIINDNFDINKLLTLVAVPTEGYRFLYWIDNNTEELYYGSPNTNGEVVYEFSGLIDRPLSLTAVFEGKKIAVTFDTSVLENTHKVIDVKINGKAVDYKYPFNALVGDTIVVRIKKTRGYGFDNSLFDCIYDQKNDCYVFTYTFAIEDLTEVDSTSYSMYMTIPVSKEDISMTFNVTISNPYDSREPSRVGYLDYFVDANKTQKIENGKAVIFKYGDTYNVRINANTNYAFLKAYMIVNGALYDVSNSVSNNILQINKEFMDRFFDYNMTFNIYFTRLIWTDEDARASSLSGEGTLKEPYKLASAKDFALMAYLINNGLKNEAGVKYSKCVYKVTNDIDFYGRFWEPIGTEENPFEGTVDIGKHIFKNVSHFKTYSSPSLSHSGLFWHVSKDAKFKIDKQALNVVIIVVCVLIFVIILIVLIIIILTIRRKKKLEKLANQ